MRFRVEPKDVPTEIAARRLGVSTAQFQSSLPRLIARGFPQADPDTGNFDLDAIDCWRKARHPHLFASPSQVTALDADQVVETRLAALRGIR